jgi:hypothetical protein
MSNPLGGDRSDGEVIPGSNVRGDAPGWFGVPYDREGVPRAGFPSEGSPSVPSMGGARSARSITFDAPAGIANICGSFDNNWLTT